MKIFGLFVVVFGGLLITKALGIPDMARMVGAVIGAGVYIIITLSA